MPSFVILHDDELEAIVSYVIHLSIRGQVEHDLLKEYFNYDKNTKQLVYKTDEDNEDWPTNISEAVKMLTKSIAEKSSLRGEIRRPISGWRFSQKPELAIKPGGDPAKLEKDLPASILRGKILFIGDKEKNPPPSTPTALAAIPISANKRNTASTNGKRSPGPTISASASFAAAAGRSTNITASIRASTGRA